MRTCSLFVFPAVVLNIKSVGILLPSTVELVTALTEAAFIILLPLYPYHARSPSISPLTIIAGDDLDPLYFANRKLAELVSVECLIALI